MCKAPEVDYAGRSDVIWISYVVFWEPLLDRMQKHLQKKKKSCHLRESFFFPFFMQDSKTRLPFKANVLVVNK